MAENFDKSEMKELLKWTKSLNLMFVKEPEDVFKLEKLDLKLKDIKKVPKSIGLFQNLTHLDLRYNRIEELPSEFSALKNLKSLFLTGNKLTKFPHAITEMTNLEELRIGNNPIEKLPSFVGDMKSLKSFDVHYCKLSSLPDEIGNLTKLEELNAGANTISNIPLSICHMRELRKLNLWSNLISELPEEMCEMENLTELLVWSNKLTRIPDCIKKLPNLKEVELNVNQDKINSKMIQAVKDDETAMVSELLTIGANVNYKSDNCAGYNFTTALFEAKSLNMVKLLIEKGADPHIKREKKGTATIKVWENDSQSSGQFETFLTRKHPLEIAKFVKGLK